MTTDAPGELIALSPVARRGALEVDGIPIRWCSWPGEGVPIVLIHGGGAHVGWWLDVAEILSPRPVIAFDLSGHGDSGHREEYRILAWAEEAHAIIGQLAGGSATVVAHSMGGRAGVVLAAQWPESVRSLVLIDSVLPTHSREPVPRPSFDSPRLYATPEQAIARFRLVPPSPATPEPTRARLGAASIRRVDGGWRWKFDPRVFRMEDAEIVNRAIPAIRCPVGIIIALESDVTDPAMTEEFARLLGRPVEQRVVADRGHHLMVDDPEGTAALIAEMISAME